MVLIAVPVHDVVQHRELLRRGNRDEVVTFGKGSSNVLEGGGRDTCTSTAVVHG